MHGLHLMAELHRCAAPAALLTDPDTLRTHCTAAVRDAGLHAVGDLFHRYAPAAEAAGVTGVVLLAESHLAVHTWPEVATVTLDVYVCNRGSDNAGRAHALMTALERLFEPGECVRHAVQRGAVPIADRTV